MRRTLARGALTLGIMAMVGGWGRAEAAPKPGKYGAGHAADAAKGPPKAPKDALIAAADEIARQVAALRGLTAKGALQRGVLTRDEIGQKLKERIAKEYTPEEVRAESRVLKRLGLLPPDADYQQMLVDLLMEQVAGFYDPFAQRLYIADWLPLEMQRPALAHEIEHALQDQHFGLKRFAEPIKDDGDRQLAHSALVEGDGTALMLEFQAQAMRLPIDQLPDLVQQIGAQMLKGGLGQTPLFDKAPAFLKETLIFPYLSGLTFVESFRKAAPWSKLDEVWRTPPETTEQVLHPDKYRSKERAVKITPGPIPSLGPRKEIRRDVLGELELRLLFASRLPAEVAEKAAAGWGGDRLVAYADPAAPEALPLVIDLSAWDTETDAKEAEAAARSLMAKLSGRPELLADKPQVYADPNGQEWGVERSGDRVLMFFGAPPEVRAQAMAQVWKTWVVK
jgi:hypothetical protein